MACNILEKPWSVLFAEILVRVAVICTEAPLGSVIHFNRIYAQVKYFDLAVALCILDGRQEIILPFCLDSTVILEVCWFVVDESSKDCSKCSWVAAIEFDGAESYLSFLLNDRDWHWQNWSVQSKWPWCGLLKRPTMELELELLCSVFLVCFLNTCIASVAIYL